MFSGYSSSKRNTQRATLLETMLYPTVQKIDEYRHGLDVYASFYHQRITIDSVVEDTIIISTKNNTIIGIQLTAHVAKIGDLIRFKTGNSAYREFKVFKIKDANNFYLAANVDEGEISAGDTFDILRPTQPRVNSNGDLIVSVASETLDPAGDNYINTDMSLSPITTGADVDIITVTAAEIASLMIENQSGFNFYLKRDGVNAFIIPKGFSNIIDFYPCTLGTVINLESIDVEANAGQITINSFKRP